MGERFNRSLERANVSSCKPGKNEQGRNSKTEALNSGIEYDAAGESQRLQWRRARCQSVPPLR